MGCSDALGAAGELVLVNEVGDSVVDQPRSLTGASASADVPETTTLRIQRRRHRSGREATIIVSVESVELGACVADAVRSPVLLSPSRACTRGLPLSLLPLNGRYLLQVTAR